MEPNIRTGEDDGVVPNAGLHSVLHQHAPHRRHRPVGSKHVPVRGTKEGKPEPKKYVKTENEHVAKNTTTGANAKTQAENGKKYIIYII